MTPVLDKRLLSLGHAVPKQDISDLRSAVSGEAAAVWDMVFWHRVVGLAHARSAAAGLDVPQDFAVLVSQRKLLRELLETEWRLLEGIVTELNIPVAGIKGYAMRELYDEPSHRDLSDMDLMVATADHAWALAKELRSQGYDWYEGELPWLKRDEASGTLYGQLPLRRYDGEVPLRADIHFGGYSIRHCRFIASAPANTGLHIFSAMENLPFLVGNAAGDFVIRLKDINDISLMLEREAASDWAEQLKLIRGLGLGGFWNALLEQVKQYSALSPAASAKLAQVWLDGVRAQRVPLGRPSWGRRWRATVADAFWAGRNVGLRKSFSLSLGAYKYYRPRLSLTVTDKCAHADGYDTLRKLTNDKCVRLIPSALVNEKAADKIISALSKGVESKEIDGSRAMTVVEAERHSFLAVDGETYVPTIFYDVCPVQARLVKNAR